MRIDECGSIENFCLLFVAMSHAGEPYYKW